MSTYCKTPEGQELTNVLKQILNILRSEGLTGDKALRNMSYLLILKLIEPRIGSIIDFDNYDYDEDSFCIPPGVSIETHKKEMLKIVRFSNLASVNECDISNNIKYLWNDILSEHPATAKIFLTGKGFDIKYNATFKKIITSLIKIDLSTIPFDILGKAYEEVIKDIMTGKVLGQFFTQPIVKNLMVKLIDPQIHSDGTIETCCDPTMGTGGFLITYLQTIMQQAKDKNITLDWDFIKTRGLYGKELEPDTYQLAISNMLISSGHMFEKIDQGDTIRQPIDRKFDCVLANPPFGIKGLNYDDFKSSIKNEYIPIKTDNAVSLFIQAIIYILKINGRCAVVLPDGQDLFSKSNKSLVMIREYLMKTCELKEIIYLPSGSDIFENTNIKTCVFYFVKKMEGVDILEITDKITKSKAKKATPDKTYKFSKTHQTTSVKFYNYKTEDSKELLVEVPIENIASNSYSLNYAEYMKNETHEQYDDEIVMKTLGEVCDFIGGKKRKADEAIKPGKYKFITCSIQGCSYLDTYDFEDKALVINSINGSGRCMIYCVEKYSTTTNNFHFKVKNKDNVLTEYLYYYLYSNIKLFEDGFLGSNQKKISKEYIENIQIPIPSLAKQNEIVEYLDFIYEKTIKTSKTKIAELKMLNEYCLKNQENCGKNVVKTLEEVCKVNQGTYIKTDMKIIGEYPVYGGGNISSYINQYNRENEIIVAKDGVSSDCVRYETKKFFLNHHGWSITCNDNIIKKYMFYYLISIQRELLSIAKGIGQLGINQENFYKLKIPIPSLARQKEIVDYCEHNESLIKQLENEIELNKTQARQFLKGIVKTQEQDDEPENIIPVYEMDHNAMADEEDDAEDAYEKLMEEYKKNEEEQDYSQNIVASLI